MEKSNTESANSNDFSVEIAGQDFSEVIERIEQYYGAGQLKQAKRLCREVLQYEPENTIVLRQMGVISHRLGELTDAFDCFSELTKLEPEDDAVFYNLGHTSVLIGNLDLAFAAFAKTVELNPASARAYNNLGVILERRGDYEAAADYFYDASEADEKHSLSRVHLVDCLFTLQRLDECRQVIDDSLKIDTLSADQRGDLLVDRAVIAWLRSDIDACSRVLRLCKHVFSYMQTPEVYAQPYLDLLIGLLEYRMRHPHSYKFEFDENIFYAGDQQCLTVNNTLFEIDNQRCCVNACLVADARMSDFIADGANSSKAGFEAVIDILPEKARLMVGFGEFDCRAELGLYPELKAKKQDVDVYLKNLACQYLDYVASQCALKN